jgi:hypothetical protein
VRDAQLPRQILLLLNQELLAHTSIGLEALLMPENDLFDAFCML